MIWGIAALSVLCLLLAAALFFSRRRPEDPGSLLLVQQQLTSLQELMSRSMGDVSVQTGQQLDQLNTRLDHRLQETAELVQNTQKTVGDRLDRNSQISVQLQERLVHLEEANKALQTVGADIARLQDILRVPKLRGNLGELFLEELLSQILPPAHYQMQYAFKGGEKADAVLRLPQGHLVSIDAKFPLENFQRMIAANVPEAERENHRKAFVSDFRKHVDQIAAKYIRPEEGTLDFALLYVPAENVFYEAILRDDEFGKTKAMNSYALSKRVIPVSPNSLYAYLQVIVLGLRGMKIETQAREIFALLSRMKSELDRLRGDLTLTSKHFANARGSLESSEKRAAQIHERLDRLDDSGSAVTAAAPPPPSFPDSR